ncbi:MAG: class I SAM-dependent methyltransferase [Phycisphaerae bacterium]|nr:class I SAM-dependent methyltransferase [Phycisphaerae bacterium]
MAEAYRDDLAYVHDRGFTSWATGAAAVLLRELRRRRIHSGLVVDLGCGSGRLAEEVCAAGYDVLGIDLSPAMIRIARKRAPAAAFRVGSFVGSDLPSCVAVTAVGEVFNYLFDRRNDGRALTRTLRGIHKALIPGGVLLFDVAAPGREPAGAARRFTQDADWTVLVEVEEDPRRHLLTRRITTFRRAGRHYRRDEEVHRLRLLARPKVETLLRETGFRVRTLRRYGAVRLPSSHFVYVAVRAHV